MALAGPLPPPAGGMANQAQLLLNYLTDDNKQVIFIRTNEDYKPAWIGRIKILRSVVRLLFFINTVWKTAGEVKLFHVLSNSGWSWHLFSAPVIIIAKIRKVPVIINYRGGEADAFFSRSWKWVKPVMNTAALVTVPTAYLESVFKKWGIKTNIVPNIIDLDLFSPEDDSDNKKKSLHFIVTRNLEKIYGNDIVIQAFALIKNKFPEAKLTIAGSGPEEQNLKKLVESLVLKDSVTFTGKLDRENMAELYKSADILLNASHVDNTPNSIIEALACGVLVISSSVGGIPWLVEHKKTALLTQENTPEDIFNNVEQLLNNQVLIMQLKENGYRLAQQFTWENVKEKLYANYNRVLSQ